MRQVGSMTKLTRILLAALALAACRPTAPPYHCADAIGCVTIPRGAPIKFGIIETLSGGSAPGGLEQTQAITLTLQLRGNQLLGHPLQVQIEDERCSPEGGANAALQIVADPQVVGIWGTNCSSAAATANPIMSQAGLVMISPANSSPTLTSIGGRQGENWAPGYYRVAWNDTASGSAAAHFAYRQLKVTRAAVINAGDAYTKGLTDVFKQVFTGLGGQIVGEVTIDEDDANQNPTLDAVALSGAQMLFFPLSHPDASTRLVQQARRRPALKDLVLIGGEAILSEAFTQKAGVDAVGVYIAGPAPVSSPDDLQLRDAYKAAYGAYPTSFYYSFAHDAATWLLDTVAKTATVDEEGTVHLGRQALRTALSATTNYTGHTGQIQCDAFGDCGTAKLNIVRVEQANLHLQDLRVAVVYTYTARP